MELDGLRRRVSGEAAVSVLAPPALARRLTGSELISLQLHARGYGPPLCCELAGHARNACEGQLAEAAVVLGVASAADAVPEARRRGLVL